MPSIEDWLAEIGLGKYGSVFEEAEIDFDTLPGLVEDDLRELNLPVGPRRKISTAIALLAQSKSTNGQRVRTLHESLTEAAKAQAERRHMTVMFVDLVGSTEMVMRMDAEDMRAIITEYQQTVASVVDEFDGFIATLLGDGMLCYFGWPQANEDDTERAVRAGLSIIKATKKLTTPDGDTLASRVGVASGVVVVGDLIGGGAKQEAAIVGETPNLSARLQAVAAPNQLVVPSEALPLLGSTFDLVSLGEQRLKGVGRAVEAFAVNGETTVESRFAARRSGVLTPIVGRDREINKILESWSCAQSRRGNLVIVSGEAGIGKSRIVLAVVDAVATDEHTRVTYQCSPYHTESAFYPFIQQLSYEAGFAADDTTQQRLAKMNKTLNIDRKSKASIALLLGLDGTALYDPSDAAPAQQRAELMQVLIDLLLNKAKEKPLLLVFEDLHWIDPTSLELLEILSEALSDHRIMILATTRPSFDGDFGRNAAVKRLTLERLDKTMTYAIAGKLTGGKALPDEIMKIIARRTDGVPLFIEELTKTILESGVLKEEADTYLVDGPLSDIAIPATLHDSLMARLDRLGDIKEVAQIAACIGRDFDHALMCQISGFQEEELEDAFDQLIGAELIHRKSFAPWALYSFKHALVRDAAYESLLKERRRNVHGQILEVLETDPSTAPELLAAHAEAARQTDRAVELLEEAGIAAISRPAYKEAEVHLRRALALNAPKVAANDPAAIEKAMSLHVQLSLALTPVTGLWSDEVVATLEQALTLADKVGETPVRGDISYGLLVGEYFRGNLVRSIAHADELRAHAVGAKDDAQLLVATRLAAVARLNFGQFKQAEPYFEEAEKLCNQLEDQDLAKRFGHDPIVGVRIYQSLSATFRGQTARAGHYRAQAENRVEKLSHTSTACGFYGLAAVCAHVAGNIDAERRSLDILLPLIAEHNVVSSRLWAEGTFALLKMADGDKAGIEAYREADSRMIDTGIRLLLPGYRAVAARRAFALGLIDEAQKMSDAAQALMHETGEKSWLPEIHRLSAAFERTEGGFGEAEQHLKKAIDISRRDGGALWELRAAIDLAKLYGTSGRKDKAIATLTTVTKNIKEGDCPQEMNVARELLRRLGMRT
jgi:class 3 adenylate cyclase/tetratricopeptide (TPR) repeat protein